MSNYEKKINFDINHKKVFNAISLDLGLWWGDQSHKINSVNQIFKVSWGEPWYQFKVVEYGPFQKMSWQCIDANQKIDGLKNVEKEWVDTIIHWHFKKLNNDKTILHFVHEGLNPGILCFDFCSKSWDHFLLDKLSNHLNSLDS